jgi:hypothetical protein
MAVARMCDVWKVGPNEDGLVLIALIDKAEGFGMRWFIATESVKREMLATALAAMASGFPVEATLESTDEYSRIMRLYAHKA